MLTSGDVIGLDPGVPRGREAGLLHPAVVVTAQPTLDAVPSVLQIVPLTSTNRGFRSEVPIAPDGRNGLDRDSVAQCQHIRAVSTERVDRVVGNVGPVVLTQIRETIGLILDIGG